MKQSKNKQVVIGEPTKKNIYLQDIEQETKLLFSKTIHN